MASITLKNLTKRWGEFVAVDNLNLEIHNKEFLVLLGPSGCGKTTTMRMIAGLEQETAGNVYINDIKVNKLEPKDRDVAMVFQSYGLYPNMNVYENIRFPLKIRKTDPKTHDRRVKHAAEMVELLEYLHSNLSRQKVPRSIDFVTELPRLPTGKLYKRVLRDKYWGEGKNRIIQEILFQIKPCNNFNDLNNNITESKIGSSSAQATARLPKKEIIIKANSTSWVEITKSNGEIILSKLMRKGDVVDTIANENYYFSTGNAGALTLETPSITPFKLGKIGEILRDLPLNLKVISVRKSLIEN